LQAAIAAGARSRQFTQACGYDLNATHMLIVSYCASVLTAAFAAALSSCVSACGVLLNTAQV
jgi:hypothetical protein